MRLLFFLFFAILLRLDDDLELSFIQKLKANTRYIRGKDFLINKLYLNNSGSEWRGDHLLFKFHDMQQILYFFIPIKF